MNQETLITSNSYLSFNIGNELFAAHVSKVLNILELTKITAIPQSPEYMLGVINLRGTVLPVIDTRIKFGITASEFTSHTCIIVMEINLQEEAIMIGALVDSVSEVLEVDHKKILPAPSIGNNKQTEFIKGVIPINEDFILLIDIDNVFSTDEINILKTNSIT